MWVSSGWFDRLCQGIARDHSSTICTGKHDQQTTDDTFENTRCTVALHGLSFTASNTCPAISQETDTHTARSPPFVIQHRAVHASPPRNALLATASLAPDRHINSSRGHKRGKSCPKPDTDGPPWWVLPRLPRSSPRCPPRQPRPRQPGRTPRRLHT